MNKRNDAWCSIRTATARTHQGATFALKGVHEGVLGATLADILVN